MKSKKSMKSIPYHEIGSHFEQVMQPEEELVQERSLIHGAADETLLYTGRAAIELAIRDVLNRQTASRVYLPSYLCKSMVWPFEQHGFELSYYHVGFDGESLFYEIDPAKDCDIFFAMSYFGIASSMIDDMISGFSDRGVTVMEDITHRLLSARQKSSAADYWIASLRKWFPVASGGYLGKRRGLLSWRADHSGEREAIQKLQAMTMKKEYLEGSSVDKAVFLNLFQQAESELYELSPTLAMDPYSENWIRKTDINGIVNRRRENSRILAQGIHRLKRIHPLIGPMDLAGDTPLFFPVVIKNGLRDDLRAFLQSRDIYCPVHWPNHADMEPGIEQDELSLVCDQRYDANDMDRVVRALTEWENKKGWDK